jgi:acetylornithine deacetylase/succinyl-diaminopimelate desuccinylase-like protein
VLLGFTPPDDNAHAPNESMLLTNYETGIRCVARLFEELAVPGSTGSPMPEGTR